MVNMVVNNHTQKRRKYDDIKSSNFKEASVKASFIIDFVPDVPESNHNVKINKLG